MKGILAAALALMLLWPGALAETYTIWIENTDEQSGYDLLLKDDGTLLTPEGANWDIFWVSPSGTPEEERLYKAMALDAKGYASHALLGPDGAALTGYDYSNLRYDPSGVVIGTRRNEGVVEVLDTSGKVLFSGEYADIWPNGEGGYLALENWADYMAIPEADGDLCYSVVMVDADGETRDTGLHAGTAYLHATGYEDGWCGLNELAELDGGAALVNTRGEPLDVTFDRITKMCCGKAVVKTGEQYGVYDPEEGWLLYPYYEYISAAANYSRPLFLAFTEDTAEVYDARTGEELFSRRYEGAKYVWGGRPADGVVILNHGAMNELCDLDGNVLLEFRYSVWIEDIMTAYGESEGMPRRFVKTVSESPRRECLIDLKGEPVGDEWQDIYLSLWKDEQGRYVTETYKEPEDGGNSFDWRTRRYGVIDENGENVLENRYLYVDVLDLDRYWVETADRYGMIDGAGKWYFTIEKYASLMD